MPDYRPLYTEEENKLFDVRTIATAILMTQGIERKLAVAEAFRITDEVREETNIKIEEKVRLQIKHAKGY